MPSDAYREARAAAKEARAEAKRARRRWLDLRPWYFKKRFVLGIPVLVVMAAAVAFLAISLDRGDSGDPTSERQAGGGDAAADASAGVARIGTLVRIGSIDLTVIAFEPFDGGSGGPASTANYRLSFRATNARGPRSEEYRLDDAAFRLVDGAGATHEEWHAACPGCPSALGAGQSLAAGASVEAVVYFRIPAGQTAAELHYRSPASTNTGRIALQ